MNIIMNSYDEAKMHVIKMLSDPNCKITNISIRPVIVPYLSPSYGIKIITENFEEEKYNKIRTWEKQKGLS